MYKKVSFGGCRFVGLAMGTIVLLQSASPVWSDDALVVKHENMKRFYDETHKPPPPTLVEIKAAAEKGDAASQVALAEVYESQADHANALLWYRKAADQGFTNALFKVGDMLLNGCHASTTSPDAIPADPNDAVAFLGRAANLGLGDAQFELGGCYRDGVGVSQDLLEAFKWFSLAARQTNAPATKEVRELTLKLRSEQIAAAQTRIKTFVPGKETELPQPAYLDKLRLNGISGTRNNRLAIINNHTFGAGDEMEIKLDEGMVDVRCLSIKDQSVLLQVGPYRKELQYRD